MGLEFNYCEWIIFFNYILLYLRVWSGKDEYKGGF